MAGSNAVNLLSMDSGKNIHLRPASLADRRQIYAWLAHSDVTASMIGPPDFPDNDIPTWDFFVQDYNPAFFDDEDPYQGRSYIIEHNGVPIGHINYNEFTKGSPVELDIWLGSNRHCNKGFGTEAILLLCEYLHQNLECRAFILAPSARNTRAVRAYEKAGFIVTKEWPDGFLPDYPDTVVMVKCVD